LCFYDLSQRQPLPGRQRNPALPTPSPARRFIRSFYPLPKRHTTPLLTPTLGIGPSTILIFTHPPLAPPHPPPPTKKHKKPKTHAHGCSTPRRCSGHPSPRPAHSLDSTLLNTLAHHLSFLSLPSPPTPPPTPPPRKNKKKTTTTTTISGPNRFCHLNNDCKHDSCEAAQEISNDEIDILLTAQTDAEEAAEALGHSKGKSGGGGGGKFGGGGKGDLCQPVVGGDSGSAGTANGRVGCHSRGVSDWLHGLHLLSSIERVLVVTPGGFRLVTWTTLAVIN
jgi:hypothetical protein